MKRIVIEHTQGPLAGLKQIAGQAELLTLGDRPLPDHLADVDAGDRRIEFLSLISVTPRIVLYREVFPRVADRLGEVRNNWHPEQV